MNRLDSCFLKSKHGGRLLIVFCVDGNNEIYLIACVVVEIENGENWRWFLELSRDSKGIINNYSWIFNLISRLDL